MIDDVCTYIPFHSIYKGGEDLHFGQASELLQGLKSGFLVQGKIKVFSVSY